MRGNSGSGKSNNNLHDPTLRDSERARGKSGEAPTATHRHGTERRGTTGASSSKA
jgi:hypothetical protein